MFIGQKVVCVYDLNKAYEAHGLEKPEAMPAYGETLVIAGVDGHEWIMFDKFNTDDSEAWWDIDSFRPLKSFRIRSDIPDVEAINNLK